MRYSAARMKRKWKSYYSAEFSTQNALSYPLFHLLGFLSYPREGQDDSKTDTMIVTGFRATLFIADKQMIRWAKFEMVFCAWRDCSRERVTANACSKFICQTQFDELTNSKFRCRGRRGFTAHLIEKRITLDDRATTIDFRKSAMHGNVNIVTVIYFANTGKYASRGSSLKVWYNIKWRQMKRIHDDLAAIYEPFILIRLQSFIIFVVVYYRGIGCYFYNRWYI